MTRLFAIVCIWLGCAVAWMILGSTLLWRTNEVSGPLRGEVHGLWGPPGRQLPPAGTYEVPQTTKETVTTTPEQGTPVKQVVEREKLTTLPLTLDRSDVDVAFDLEHRQKGLLWFPTYGVDFRADYTFLNPSDQPHSATLSFPLQGDAAQKSVSFDIPEKPPPGRRVVGRALDEELGGTSDRGQRGLELVRQIRGEFGDVAGAGVELAGHARQGLAELIRRQTSRPSSSGNITSSTTRSTPPRSSTSSAAAPSPTIDTR